MLILDGIDFVSILAFIADSFIHAPQNDERRRRKI